MLLGPNHFRRSTPKTPLLKSLNIPRLTTTKGNFSTIQKVLQDTFYILNLGKKNMHLQVCKDVMNNFSDRKEVI